MANESSYSPDVHVDRHVGVQVQAMDPSIRELVRISFKDVNNLMFHGYGIIYGYLHIIYTGLASGN